MNIAIAVAGCVAEAGLIYAMVILLRLSRKLGDVMKMRPYYRGYYLSIAFLSVALITHFLAATLLLSPGEGLPDWLLSPWFYPVFHHGMLAIGLTASLPIIWKYWGWLARE